MRQDLKKLLHLQSLDLRTRQLGEEEVARKRELEALEEKIRADEEMAEEEKARWKEIQVQIKELELQVDEKKNQINKYQQQLLQIKTNKEYQALLLEIEGLKGDIRHLEDAILELMEAAEKEKKKMDRVQSDLEAERKKYREEEEAAARDLENISREKEEIKNKRKGAAESLEEDLLEKYERIFEHKPDRALVPVVAKTCRGCNMQLTGQVLNDLQKDDEIHYCENCGRLIYLPE